MTGAVRAAIQALLDLRSALAVVPGLRASLSSASSPLLASIRDVVCAVPALHALAARIEQLLDDEVCTGKAAFITVTQQVFAIRAGVDGFLDVGKSCNMNVWKPPSVLTPRWPRSPQDLLHNDRGHPRARRCAVRFNRFGHQGHVSAAQGLLSSHSCARVRGGFSRGQTVLCTGAHPMNTMTRAYRGDSVLSQATKKGRIYICSTGELDGLNVRLQDVAKDALLLSIRVADGVVVAVRDALPALTAFSEAVSLLDVLVNAFAATVSGSALPFVRPRLTLDGPLAIGNGRHPVACAHMRAEGREFVANSSFCSDSASFGASFCGWRGVDCMPTAAQLSRACCAVVITGANMSGKTTYLKQVRYRVNSRCGCILHSLRATIGGGQCRARTCRLLCCRRVCVFPADGPPVFAAGQRRRLCQLVHFHD